jgi:hypothetical protein
VAEAAAPGKAAPRRALTRCLAAAALYEQKGTARWCYGRPGHGARPRALGQAPPNESLWAINRAQLLEAAGLELGPGLVMAGLGLSGQKSTARRDHAHRDRRGLFSIHTKYGLLNRLPTKVSFSIF